VEIMNAAAELNPEFLQSRNPDAADGVPAQLYDRPAARFHFECAEDIVSWAKELI
jgi:HEPN domain-containing protein